LGRKDKLAKPPLWNRELRQPVIKMNEAAAISMKGRRTVEAAYQFKGYQTAIPVNLRNVVGPYQ
jgi:hypothetical protein